ncbi:MAG TPA: hypothetical protein ENN99_05640 [Chloroflexi bacterium]|nr:hypothetical protein [Chloroflexota bacterium]
MRENPERMAWVILLTSFFICVGLTIAVPLSIRHHALYAQVPQRATLEVQQAPLRVTLAGRGVPVAMDSEEDEIPEGTILATDATAGRLIVRVPHVENTVIATVQLYDHTNITLLSLRSPRFAPSPLPHRVNLKVEAGRVRINAFNSENRFTVIEVQTPHGSATLTEGSYEVKVNDTDTQITVRNGQANVHNRGGDVVSLGPNKRVTIQDDQLSGPLDAARSLVINGDFEAPLDRGWTTYNRQTDPQQPPGNISIITDAGREAIDFYRAGSNHAEMGIRQEINQDVRDFASLQLHMDVRIVSQDISGFGGCGYLGTECPIIVRLAYKDIYGTDREWLHGFYSGEPASDWQINWWAEQIPPGNWQTYDSANLMTELADFPPALVKSLSIYASGHNFHAMVTEIELLAQE